MGKDIESGMYIERYSKRERGGENYIYIERQTESKK